MPRKHRRQRSSLRPASNLRLRTAFSSLTVSKLDPDTEYVIYVAATTANEEFFEKVLEVEAKTASFGDNAYDVFDVDYIEF